MTRLLCVCGRTFDAVVIRGRIPIRCGACADRLRRADEERARLLDRVRRRR